MSDTPKPWFMFGKDNDSRNSDDNDKLGQELEKLIDCLREEKDGDDESIINEEVDDYEIPSHEADCFSNDECLQDDKIFNYINERLSVFPESSRLLWTAVSLALKKRRPLIADEYFKKLISIPIKRHDFDTITFEITYMLCDPFGKAAQIRKCVRFLKKQYPMREEGLFYEGILEERMGNSEKASQLFRLAVENCKRAPKSAEHLSNMMLEEAEYEESIRFAKLADIMSTSKEPIVKMSDLCFNQCLAKDALLKQRELNGETVTTDEVDELRRSYEKLKLDYCELKNSPILQERIDMLNTWRNELEK